MYNIGVGEIQESAAFIPYIPLIHSCNTFNLQPIANHSLQSHESRGLRMYPVDPEIENVFLVAYFYLGGGQYFKM